MAKQPLKQYPEPGLEEGWLSFQIPPALKVLTVPSVRSWDGLFLHSAIGWQPDHV